MWIHDNIPDLSGKTAIVTGANTGIGYETAKALYVAGADVIIAARDLQRAKDAKEKMIAEVKGRGSLEIQLLNLASLSQIKTFSQTIQEKYPQVDILINNAGVMIPPPAKTDDGFELQFGVNFIGHFALTGNLFGALKRSDAARVVTLSSGAAIRASGIDFNNLRLEKSYDAWREYAVSKLADILFTYALDRKLKAANFNMISAAAHPGVTRTDLQRHIPAEELKGLFAQFDEVMEPWQGALPTLFAATDPNASGGVFYGPDGDKEYTGYPAPSRHSTPAMNDPVLAKQLWDYAEEVTQVKFNF
ncbi:SDR family NAD(P)-dependent oxidoreductase [Fulvivirgaceae bacterium PWU20]|uniref:SDR family NAD(P)-dependent oxidoreductase n=2 Tax=Chryseosolibacter indicus TaxID=2782351 RepID=A0ABS5VT66_9BACT|nr:SDR family NAD(P)-dependent oxidoreductase [Chryseosolibacter indicus]